MNLVQRLEQLAMVNRTDLAAIEQTMKILARAEAAGAKGVNGKVTKAIAIRAAANGNGNGHAPTVQVWERIREFLAAQPEQRAAAPEVAKALGVSYNTVSSALRKPARFKQIGRGVFTLRAAKDETPKPTKRKRRKYSAALRAKMSKITKARWRALKKAGHTGKLPATT